jgi:hypothetical protein
MHYKLQYALRSRCHQFIMESLEPLISISAMANDREVDEAPHKLLNLRLMLVSANKTSPVWQYFAMVKDGPIMCNRIQYVY